MSKLRLVIADDHEIMRDGLEALISTQDDMDVVGLASNGREVIELCSQLKPDVVVMDMQMPVINGAEAISRLHTVSPQTKVLILTTYDSDEYILSGLKAGAKGYVLKDIPKEELFQAIRMVSRGLALIQPKVATRLLESINTPPNPAVASGLSDRELLILNRIAKGDRNREIAEDLGLSESTVKAHVASIFNKLNATDRTEAVTKALTRGIITLNPQQ